MACFGNDYCSDHEAIRVMSRESLIKALLNIKKFNRVLEFSREFLEKFATWKLRHILDDAVDETFWSCWEEEVRRMLRSECSKNNSRESQGD